MNIQKKQELKDVEIFLSLSKLKFDSYNMECEKPDCDLKFGKKTIGIEVTEFVRSKETCSIIRSVNSTFDRISKETKSEIEKITNLKLTLNFSQHPNPRRKINSSDRLRIIEFLIDHIRKQEIEQRLGKDLFHIEFVYSMEDSEFIKSIRISTLKDKDTLDITENKFFMTGVIPKQDLDVIIRNKELKMDFQRNKETYLLIVVAETEYSSGITNNEVLEYKFDYSKFNRIYILERFSKNLYKLNS
ncbi:MAG: hypothetical protein RL528_1970 [Bacteroidota bacterium]|jgi:hypothetical protein